MLTQKLASLLRCDDEGSRSDGKLSADPGSARSVIARRAAAPGGGDDVRGGLKFGALRMRHRQPADDEPRHRKHEHEPGQRKQRQDDLHDNRQAPDEAPLPAQARVHPASRPGFGGLVLLSQLAESVGRI
jgi:hypothetical protein